MAFTSTIFNIEQITVPGGSENIVRGGKDVFPLLKSAFDGINTIAVIGWSSQGPAQAQNLRDTLKSIGSDVKVIVGLRAGSSSISSAEEAGFVQGDTLVSVEEALKNADFVIYLISDAGAVETFEDAIKMLKPGATFGLSHGFLVGHLAAHGKTLKDLRPDVNFVGVCPKGMGPSVRRLYTQGSGINASFAVEHDANGKATDVAIGWAVGLGSPFAFETTLTNEYKSDIYGERGILLGAVHGIAEATFQYHVDHGMSEADAFIHSTETITGPISKTISKQGIKGLYESLSDADKKVFEEAYNASYEGHAAVLEEIYDDVASGREIDGVVAATKRLEKYPFSKVDGGKMWRVGEKVRASRKEDSIPVDPVTAGFYVANMMAQIDVLARHNHPWSEICNESVIEAVDSLNPYMHARGVDYMVDNCSTTARLGSRKWQPAFMARLQQDAIPAIETKSVSANYFKDFLNHPVHEALKVCADLRPPIDISVQ